MRERDGGEELQTQRMGVGVGGVLGVHGLCMYCTDVCVFRYCVENVFLI